jgi:ABC-type uncharacterized transport system substrate-binding protein
MLGGAALRPVATYAQQRPLPVVGFLGAASREESAPFTAWFLRGLAEAGFADGHDVVIDYRWAEGRYDRLPALAVELVRHQASIIFASGGGPSAPAAMAATTSVPIVFSVGDDPVKLGLVASLSRPEGNVTGVTFTAAGLGAKRLELLRELVPKAAVIALLMNTDNPTPDLYQAESAARAIGQRILVLNVTGMRDIDAAFASLVQQRADALRGAKPADLPVEQAATFELVINLKTAKTLGLSIPASLLARADEVIE